MWERLQTYWLPRFLFAGTLAAAGVLTLAVATAPWALGQLPRAGTPVRLFAEDAAVRRTALASALGLAVTAFVFFRPPPAPRPSKKPSKNAPPGNIAGA